MILQKAMVRNGFEPLDCEWWHFSLADEPHPDTYFEFPVSAANADAISMPNVPGGNAAHPDDSIDASQSQLRQTQRAPGAPPVPDAAKNIGSPNDKHA